MSDPSTGETARVDISIILPFRNSAQTISRTLDTLLQQKTNASVELLLVDDHSTDDTLQLANAHAIAQRWPVRHIPNEAGGLANAYNLGWRAARGEVVITMHTDCYLLSEISLETMYAAFTDQDVVASQSWTAVPENAWDDMGFWDKVANAPYVGTEGFGMGGKFDAVRRSTLERIGGWDSETFFSAGEDVDIGVRLKDAGKLATTDVRVVHGHLYPKESQLNSLFRKQIQLGMGFGAVLRKFGRYPGSRATVIKHSAKAILVLGLFVPVVWPLALILLLTMGALYSRRALSLRDFRVVAIPFINAAQFAVFTGAALIGLLTGKQTFYYK